MGASIAGEVEDFKAKLKFINSNHPKFDELRDIILKIKNSKRNPSPNELRILELSNLFKMLLTYSSFPNPTTNIRTDILPIGYSSQSILSLKAQTHTFNLLLLENWLHKLQKILREHDIPSGFLLSLNEMNIFLQYSFDKGWTYMDGLTIEEGLNTNGLAKLLFIHSQQNKIKFTVNVYSLVQDETIHDRVNSLYRELKSLYKDYASNNTATINIIKQQIKRIEDQTQILAVQLGELKDAVSHKEVVSQEESTSVCQARISKYEKAGLTPFLLACYQADLKAIQKLLTKKAISQTDHYGNSCLHQLVQTPKKTQF